MESCYCFVDTVAYLYEAVSGFLKNFFCLNGVFQRLANDNLRLVFVVKLRMASPFLRGLENGITSLHKHVRRPQAPCRSASGPGLAHAAPPAAGRRASLAVGPTQVAGSWHPPPSPGLSLTAQVAEAACSEVFSLIVTRGTGTGSWRVSSLLLL